MFQRKGNIGSVCFPQDVNSVAVSPNDKLLASASQDRTAKLWSLAGEGGLGLLGVCRGHRRGVWSLCFSPVDQVLATSSADGSTKLWSLQDFSCLKVGRQQCLSQRTESCVRSCGDTIGVVYFCLSSTSLRLLKVTTPPF